MTDEELKDYLEGRYAEALKWYDRRSRQNKFAYHVLSVYVFVASAFLVVAAALDGSGWKIARSIVAALITVSAGLLGLFKSHENWLGYRATWDTLKREPALKTAGVGDYQSVADRNALLVERIESAMAHEGAEWQSRHSASTNDDK